MGPIDSRCIQAALYIHERCHLPRDHAISLLSKLDIACIDHVDPMDFFAILCLYMSILTDDPEVQLKHEYLLIATAVYINKMHSDYDGLLWCNMCHLFDPNFMVTLEMAFMPFVIKVLPKLLLPRDLTTVKSCLLRATTPLPITLTPALKRKHGASRGKAPYKTMRAYVGDVGRVGHL